MGSEPQDGGQMLLLGAIVLVVAFVTLSLMVGRLSTLEQETERDETGPFLREWDAVLRGAEAAARTATGASVAVKEAQIESSIASMQALLAERGYLLSDEDGGAYGDGGLGGAGVSCPGSTGPWRVDLHFTDGTHHVSVDDYELSTDC